MLKFTSESPDLGYWNSAGVFWTNRDDIILVINHCQVSFFPQTVKITIPQEKKCKIGPMVDKSKRSIYDIDMLSPASFNLFLGEALNVLKVS